jgi:hypothetical protein
VLLNTDDGKAFVEELRDQLAPVSINPDNPTRMAYHVGQRDAYEYVAALQRGDMIDGE